MNAQTIAATDANLLAQALPALVDCALSEDGNIRNTTMLTKTLAYWLEGPCGEVDIVRVAIFVTMAWCDHCHDPTSKTALSEIMRIGIEEFRPGKNL